MYIVIENYRNIWRFGYVGYWMSYDVFAQRKAGLIRIPSIWFEFTGFMFAKVTHTNTCDQVATNWSEVVSFWFNSSTSSFSSCSACMFHMLYVFIEIQRAVPKAGKIGRPHQILPVRHARMWLSCHPYERTAPCPSGFAAWKSYRPGVNGAVFFVWATNRYRSS